MKKWLSSIFGQKQSGYPVVWDASKISIYQQLSSWQEELTPLPESLSELPDSTDNDDTEIRWANGAEDGVLGHHGSGQSETDIDTLYLLLKPAVEKGDKTSVLQFYQYAVQNTPISYIDDFLELIVKQQDISAIKLAEFTDWLLYHSPDRNIVKLAMALTIFFPSLERLNTLYCLAAHDELTLYAIFPVHAMIESPDEYEAMWLKMAKRVEGWGRVQLIERMPTPLNEETRQWMLLIGYKNDVMPEYTAWNCATHAHLSDALEMRVDSTLLAAATDILQALLNGGPARDIHDYEDASRCCFNYLKQVSQHDYLLAYYFTVQHIHEFFSENQEHYDNSNEIIALSKSILDSPDWKNLIKQGLDSSDCAVFREAIYVAKSRGQEVFSFLYEKQLANVESDLWFELMKTEDNEQAERVIKLAEQQLDLNKISSGPEDILGIGPKYQQHGKLDFLLQELHRFPGQGLPLIQCALQSPVVRNRNMALKALFSWERKTWPIDLEAFLTCCHDNEPNKETKQLFDSLLKGQPFDNN